jgi:hypothetical protein
MWRSLLGSRSRYMTLSGNLFALRVLLFVWEAMGLARSFVGKGMGLMRMILGYHVYCIYLYLAAMDSSWNLGEKLEI